MSAKFIVQTIKVTDIILFWTYKKTKKRRYWDTLRNKYTTPWTSKFDMIPSAKEKKEKEKIEDQHITCEMWGEYECFIVHLKD